MNIFLSDCGCDSDHGLYSKMAAGNFRGDINIGQATEDMRAEGRRAAGHTNGGWAIDGDIPSLRQRIWRWSC